MAALALIIYFPIFQHTVDVYYFSHGSVTAQDTPCLSDSTESFCCRQGQACLPNKLCQAISLAGSINFRAEAIQAKHRNHQSW
jgi:hypothetical protein